MKLISLDNLARFKANLDNTYGKPEGIAQLDINAKIPVSQIPGDALNVESYEDLEAFPETGREKVLYLDLETNCIYRWDVEASEYVNTSSPDSVKYIPQELTTAQKEQARHNIGAISEAEVPPGNNVQYVPQELTTAQKAQARENIDAVSVDELPDDILTYSPQELTTEQKTQARQNIDAVSTDELPDDILTYSPQVLTTEQKTQARQNIDAASNTEFSGISSLVNDINDRLNNFGDFVREVEQDEDSIIVTHNESEATTIPLGLNFNGGVVNKNELDNQYYLYLTKDDVPLSNESFTPFVIPASGGGGGGSYITLSDVVKPTTVRNGSPAVFSFSAVSSDDTDLTVKWYVDDVLYSTQSGQSGSSFSFDAGPYLKPSAESNVKVSVDSEGSANITRKYKVTSVAFAISWGESIEPIMLYTAETNIYVPVVVSAESGTTNYVTLRVGSHTVSKTVTGSATITVALDKSYFSSGINTVIGSMVSSIDEHDKTDDIQFTVIWGYQMTAPVVVFTKNADTCKQYEIADIEYFVFDPNNEIATYTIKIGEEAPKQLTANRTIQTYQYSPLDEGVINIALTCGSATATMQLTVSHNDYNLNYYTDDSLVYLVDPVGHSNSDADRESFGGFIWCQGFDWVNGGFQKDANDVPAFVVKKGNTVTLPRCLFEDSDANGKTIDLSFKVTNSDQYDAVAMQELNAGNTKGFILKANNGELRMNNVVGREFRYCEESRIDLSVHVERNVAQRVMTIWLDGIPSNVGKYETAGTLVQDENPLVIGSEHCDVWIYGIRVYNAALTKQQMIQNYIYCGNSTQEKASRYVLNTILDNNDRISVSALHTAMPDLTIVQINTERMTTSKSDKVPADITITDGATVLELPSSAGTVFMVQGTSSAAYGRSCYNLDMDFKGAKKKYKISENAIAVNYLNIKVNVASSENANNINAVDWYNTYQPYLTESRNRPGVRDAVEGKPCAVFITNTSNEAKWFSSLYLQPNETVLYAMGDLCNSKKNKDVFGQDNKVDEYVEHPTKACIEVSGNDTEPERFRSTEATFNPAADDGKGDWETEEWDEEEQKYKTVKHFEWRMNPSSSNLQDVVTSWDNAVAWVVSTMGNSAKFKNEVSNYFAIESLLYHFLFIEYFAGYDNVSKNTFYSYDWDESEQKYLWNIKAAYDMDTILAADNDGIPFGDYGLDYGDTVDGTPTGRQYFNAVTNTIWVNIKEAFQSELSSLYITLRSRGAWNSQNIINKWDNYQAKRPHASMIVDAYNKYIEPYKTTGVIIGTETKGYDDSYLPRLNGSKTYWRKQFLTYQTSYMDGKYGYFDTTNTMNFRTNGTEGKKSFTVKSYAKTYITMIKDSNRVASKKVEAGDTVTFDNVMVGNNTTMYVTPDRLIQYVRPLNETQNSTFVAAGAAKLMEVILGSENPNTDWPAGSGISVPSVLLKDFSVQNLTNFSQALSFAQNVELKTLDTRGTNAGLITLPSFAPLTSVQLNASTGVTAYNLNKVETFTMESGNNIVSLIVENCNNVVSAALATYLSQAVSVVSEATRRIRAISINWQFDNLDVLSKVASTWKGFNSLGEHQDKPVVTGLVHVTTLSKKKLEIINNVWGQGDVEDHLDEEHRMWSYGDLTITYESLIPYFTVTFNNVDDSPIKDKSGNNYVQYIDLNAEAYDPITAGEIDTPTYIDPTGEYTYTYTGWSNLGGRVDSDKTVTAVYTKEIITYTVRWYDKQGGTMYDERTNVPYGSEAVYDPEGTIGFPTLTDEESANIFKVFMGWDKSTGSITEDTNVYAVWDRQRKPTTSIALKDMSIAQIYSIAKTHTASNFFNDGDFVDITVGRDFTFENVSSEVLLENRYFDGTEILKMQNIKLFDENTPSFTIAIDYEFCSSENDQSLISCGTNTNDGINGGFRIYQTSNNINVGCGDKTNTVGHGYNRSVIVLRHKKGTKSLLVAADNNGRYVTKAEAYENDIGTRSYYAGYNPAVTTAELGRLTDFDENAFLCFGAEPFGTQGTNNPAKGWIHWCKIWYSDLGRENAKELAIWPHETWRMHYRGENIYTKTDGTGIKASASFIANALLSQYYEMYPAGQQTSAGGWEQSVMREFVNDRCFKALPYCWQAIIQPVFVISKSGGDAQTPTITTEDKLYLPALADEYPITNAYDKLEGTQISWYVNNRDRVKFMGLNLRDDAQVIQLADDPTTYTDTYTIREGDVWINTKNNSNVGYIYISQQTYDKHTFYGGRLLSDTTNNLVAAGTQGGMWIRAAAYHSRTNFYNPDYPEQSYYKEWHYSTNPIGGYNQYHLGSRNYQVRGVAIMFSI